MTIWDTLSGRKASAQPAPTTAQPQDHNSSYQSTSTSTFDPSSVSVSDFLGGSQPFDPSSLHPLAGLDQDSLDYLKLDDGIDLGSNKSALPSRGWSDDLCYGTGITYLAGLSVGGAWGLAEGLQRSPASAPPKLRLNSVLNAVTRRGPFLGNSAGVIAMVYNGINSTIGYYRGKHEAVNSVAAGALSGMIFKSTRGLRPMLVSGAMVAGAAGAWQVSCRSLSPRVSIILTQISGDEESRL